MASDELPGFLGSARVAVVGLGLIGGSLAQALRGRCGELLGIDPDPRTLDLARHLGIASRLAADPADLLPEADAVILAAPVRAILSLIDRLPGLHPGRALVMDVGSTKTAVVRALEGLPERFDPIGGHPMGGKERGGLANADPGIFRNAAFALTPLTRTSTRARQAAVELAAAVGARPLWIDPERHDRYAAATSHLAVLVSASLAAVTPVEAASLAGPGFRSTTRLAASDPGMVLDILLTNPGNVRASLAQFRDQLDRFDRALAGEDVELLKSLLAEGRDRREAVLAASELKEAR